MSPSAVCRQRRRQLHSINVCLGGITRVAANRAQARAAATFRFRSVDPLECDLHKKWHRGQRPYRHQGDRSRLSNWPFDLVRDQHSNSKSERGPRQRKQIVQRNLVGRFWNGYRERHRLLISPVCEKETGKSPCWRDLRYWQLLTCRNRFMR